MLFVLSDQERGWSQYPSGFIEKHAPARQWLRENGVHFTDFQTPNALCSPARGIIASGAQSPVNGMWDNAPIIYSTPLRTDRPTVGTLFQDAGYTTGYAGKWHLSHFEDETGSTPEQRRQINRTIKSYGFDETDNGEETDGPLTGWQHDDRTVERAIGFIRRRQSDERPWFLSVNLLNPHDIMYYTSGPEMTATRVSQFPDASARPPFEDPLYAEDLGYELTENFGPSTYEGRASGVQEYHLTFSEAMGHFDYEDRDAGREMQNYYWNCTRDSDRHLKRLLDALETSGMMDDTIVVFTSDHGEILGSHGIRGKGTGVFREQNHVPAIIVHPDGAKGAEISYPLSHIDWVPTLLGLAGVPGPVLREQMPMIVGRDFSRLVFEPGAPSPRADTGVLLLWSSIAFQRHQSVRKFDAVRKQSMPGRLFAMRELVKENLTARGQMRAIYDGRWKFARYGSPIVMDPARNPTDLFANYDLELFDTAADPAEIRNLARDPAFEGQIASLNQRLNDLVAREIGDDDASFLPFYMRA
ncbi:sulfatase-like hydrolase/transferase [Parerythrobacter aurantius]|uniref:sulfatase-like hydrolase/transferase n=1 Tax=Parerythrobacter aurantius TaxID=3127706 RepID=UPI00324D166C